MCSRQAKILYLASCWPLDKAFGGQLRTLQVGRALQKVGDVTLAVASSDAVGAEVLRDTAAEFNVEAPIQVCVAPNRGLTDRLRWAFDTRFLNVHGCVARDADRSRVLRLREIFDLIWVSEARTANILNEWRWQRSILDIGDIPSTYQRSVWRSAATLNEKLKAGVMTILLKRREKRFKERFEGIAVCSEADRRYLGGGGEIHVIPNGFSRPAADPVHNPTRPPRIGFIGLYSYPPNLEGMRWFLRECWPLVRRDIPDVRLRLVGKDTDGPLKPCGQEIDLLGWVADPADEIRTWSAMVIPVRRGAGTRVKIVDAFSRKCPVVSTSLGAFGYDVVHGRELLLADDPVGFASACVSVVRDPASATSMAERAYRAFLEKWTWEAIAPRVGAAAEMVLRNGTHE